MTRLPLSQPAVSKKKWPRSVFPIIAGLLFAASTWSAHTAADNDTELPTIGDASSGIVAQQLEKELGESWLKSLRRQVRTIEDPLINGYFHDLVYQLVPNSALQNRKLKLVIVDSAELNAFAVPGGIIGINAGLFLHAKTEQEFASVIAHEIAHLSQRHYARNVEYMQKTAPLQLAGLLASVIVAAAAGSDAGMAALAGTQALGAQEQLGYSRKNEQEADREGLKTLYASGMDPKAMSAMFERMLQNNRYAGRQLPEYLSTHPLTASRVADTKNRADQYPTINYAENPEFYLMQARVLVHFSQSMDGLITTFRSHLADSPQQVAMQDKYSLALALMGKNQQKEAIQHLNELLQRDPLRTTFVVTKAEAMAQSGELDNATQLLENAIRYAKFSFPLRFFAGKLQVQAGKITEAEQNFIVASQLKPDEPAVWYELAEVHGLARNIVALHQARAEYFSLMGRYKEAIAQLELAQKKNQGAYPTSTVIDQRLQEIHQHRAKNRF